MIVKLFSRINYKYLFFVIFLTVVLLGCVTERFQFPPCPFSEFIGFCCPMCGSTRAWRVLLDSGDIAQALRFNPIFWLWSFWCTVAYLDVWCRTFKLEHPSLGEKLIVYLSRHQALLHSHLLISFITLVYLNLPSVVYWRESLN